LLLAVIVVSACTSTGRPPEPTGDVAVTVGPAATTIPFAGGSIEVPQGAVPSPTTLRISAVAEGTPTGVINDLAHPLGRGIRVDLSGRQPTKPLRLSLNLPPGFRPPSATPIFVASVQSGGSAATLLPAEYDPAVGRVVVELPHLSLFTPVWLDVEQLAEQLAESFTGVAKGLFALRAPRPSCSDEDKISLPDGRVVEFGPAPWRGDADPDIYGCLSPEGSGSIALQVTDNRPTGFSFEAPDGATVTTSLPQRAADNQGLGALTRVLYDVSTAGTATDRHLLTALATATIHIPVTRLPTHLTLRADGGLALVGALQFGASELLAVLTGGGSGAVNKALLAKDAADCVLGGIAALDGVGGNDQEYFAAATKLALDCLARAIKATGGTLNPFVGAAVSVLTLIVSAGIGALYALLDVTLRPFFQADTVDVPILLGARASEPPPCPAAPQVLDAAVKYLAENGYRPRTPAVFAGSLRCAGPYVAAGLVSPDFPDGLRVLLRQGPDGLRALKTGTGPLCSSDPADGVVVVPRRYLSTLDCIPASS
jgi:hypothetical protein